MLDHCRELAPEGFTHAHVDTATGRATTNIVSVMQHTRIQGVRVEIITTVRGKVAHAGDVRCVKIPEVYILTRATNQIGILGGRDVLIWVEETHTTNSAVRLQGDKWGSVGITVIVGDQKHSGVFIAVCRMVPIR